VFIYIQVIPKGHRSGRIGMHQCCAGGTWYIMIEEEEMNRSLGKAEIFTDVILYSCLISWG